MVKPFQPSKGYFHCRILKCTKMSPRSRYQKSRYSSHWTQLSHVGLQSHVCMYVNSFAIASSCCQSKEIKSLKATRKRRGKSYRPRRESMIRGVWKLRSHRSWPSFILRRRKRWQELCGPGRLTRIVSRVAIDEAKSNVLPGKIRALHNQRSLSNLLAVRQGAVLAA